MLTWTLFPRTVASEIDQMQHKTPDAARNPLSPVLISQETS